ncbi:DUF2911 domain-containing protein [Cecembia sp.]|uniref:DUF2911 domain-containing protein n=1 Tax=Cecembia sp. TaxID=1898110 RepID=UPI0025C1969E|nr:DUF2911 domain-containing protein [Cecembia sp.]
MLKKVLIGLGIFILILVIAFAYMNYRSRSVSPPEVISLEVDGLQIEFNYSRPTARGRLIFGTEAEGALLPFGKYWRLGANESTEITINQNVSFNGAPLNAGTYRLYAIPGPESFRIGVNTELGKWGAWEPDYSKDVFVTEVPVNPLDQTVEQLTARLEAGEGAGAILYFEWAEVQLAIPIAIASQ